MLATDLAGQLTRVDRMTEKTHETNYYTTLIQLADDCPARSSEVPEPRGGKQTVASMQYEMLVRHPFEHTQPELLFDIWHRRTHPDAPPEERGRLHSQFWAKPQACLRSSPLPKRYGFGLLFDTKGRVKLCPAESDEYLAVSDDAAVKKVKALRSSRG